MNKKKLIISGFIMALFVVSSIVVARHYATALDLETPDAFEENHYDIELDFWLNVSGSISPAGIKSDVSWEYLHARYSFSSRESLAKIYGYDIFSVEFFELNGLNVFISSDYACKLVHEFSDKGLQNSYLQEISFERKSDDQADSYYGIAGATTDYVYYPASEEGILGQGATTTYLMNYSKAFDDTTEPTLTLDSHNILTKSTDEIFLGTTYHATDSYSINDYGTMIAEGGGVTLYNIANASTISWMMENDEINLVSINFEVPQATISPAAMHLQEGVLKRFAFSLVQRVKDRVTSSTSSLRRNLMNVVPISRVISGIRSVPSAAEYYSNKEVGTHWYDKILGVTANAGGIKNTVIKFFTSLFSGSVLTVAVLAYGGIGIYHKVRGIGRGKILWNPFKEPWIRKKK